MQKKNNSKIESKTSHFIFTLVIPLTLLEGFSPLSTSQIQLMKDKHSIFGRKLNEQQYLNCTPSNNVIEAGKKAMT